MSSFGSRGRPVWETVGLLISRYGLSTIRPGFQAPPFILSVLISKPPGTEFIEIVKDDVVEAEA